MASILSSILGNRCPRCRKGRLFSFKNPYYLRRMHDMPEQCPRCGQDFVIEPGFFFGATYISYALNVGWLIPSFLFISFVLNQPYSVYLIFMAIVLPASVPILFRLSRSAWIHMFVNYDPSIASRIKEKEQDGEEA